MYVFSPASPWTALTVTLLTHDPKIPADSPAPQRRRFCNMYQISYGTPSRCERTSHSITERTLTGCETLARAIPSGIDRSGFQ